MLRGLRASDAPTIQQLVGNDQRLLLRIGALLQAKLALSQAVLEELARADELRALLMDRRLTDISNESFAAVASERNCADLDLVVAAGAPGDDNSSWRVLAFADELNNPLVADPAASGNAVVRSRRSPGPGPVAANPGTADSCPGRRAAASSGR